MNCRTVILTTCGFVAAAVTGGSACLAQDTTVALGGSAGDTIAFSGKFVDPLVPRNSYETSIGWTVRGKDAWEFRWMRWASISFSRIGNSPARYSWRSPPLGISHRTIVRVSAWRPE